ncbi:MAG: type II toxin-antitoxin system RelE/ParE family toxin [Nitrospirales bacterium]
MSQESVPKEIIYYVTAQGEEPFIQWLDGLSDRRSRNRIRTKIHRVSLGNLGDHKSVGDGVFELRLDYGPGFRVYCGFEGDALVVLLCGGDKSSQEKDIQLAQTYWEDYRSRDDA